MIDYSTKTLLNNCSVIKLCLLISVVLYHSSAIYTGKWTYFTPNIDNASIGFFSEWLNTFHIYGFALASGFIFSYIMLQRGGYTSFKKFLQNKSKRLLIPYFFTAIIWVIPIRFLFEDIDFNEIFKDIFLAKAPNQLWFLIMLFNVFIIIFSLNKFIKRSNIFCIILSITSYCLGIIGSSFLPNYFQIWNTLIFLTSFIIGYKLYQYKDYVFSIKILSNHKYIVIIFLLVFDILLFYTYKILPSDTIINKSMKLLISFCLKSWGGLGSFLILLIIIQSLPMRIFHNKIIDFLVSSSMIIYLFHQQIIYFCIKLFYTFPPMVLVLGSFILSLIASSIIAYIINKNSILFTLAGNG